MVHSKIIYWAAAAAFALATIPAYAITTGRGHSRTTSTEHRSTLARSSAQPRPAAARVGVSHKIAAEQPRVARKTSVSRTSRTVRSAKAAPSKTAVRSHTRSSTAASTIASMHKPKSKLPSLAHKDKPIGKSSARPLVTRTPATHSHSHIRSR